MYPNGIQSWLLGVLADVGAFVLQLIVFALVMLVGWLIALAVSKGLTFLLQRIRLPALLEKAGLNRLLAPLGVDPLTLVVKIVYYFILLVTLLLALTAFGPSNPVSGIVTSILHWLPSAFVAVIIVIVVTAIANFVGGIIRRPLSKFRFGGILTNVIVATIIAMGAIAALNQMGVAVTVTTPILYAVLFALAGIAIVGIGGGLITPMRGRWEKWLTAIEEDAAKPTPPAPEPAPQQPAPQGGPAPQAPPQAPPQQTYAPAPPRPPQPGTETPGG